MDMRTLTSPSASCLAKSGAARNVLITPPAAEAKEWTDLNVIKLEETED